MAVNGRRAMSNAADVQHSLQGKTARDVGESNDD